MGRANLEWWTVLCKGAIANGTVQKSKLLKSLSCTLSRAQVLPQASRLCSLIMPCQPQHWPTLAAFAGKHETYAVLQIRCINAKRHTARVRQVSCTHHTSEAVCYGW